MLGNMLGSADIIAQMSDRCYLEKCRDRLFPEFVEGGLAARDETDHRAGVQFKSAEELVVRTPGFYRKAMDRLNNQLDGAPRFAQTHLKGRNLYIETIERHMQIAIE